MEAERQANAWQDFAFHWLTKLSEELGARYRVDWSQNFILLSPRDARKAKLLLQVVEHQRERILRVIGDDSFKEGWGFYTLLVFESVREYERYVSHFGPGGAEAGSGGMFIGNEFYGHIALYGTDARILEIVLAHELTHNLFWPSHLPLWLEEGICQMMEEYTASFYREPVDRKKVAEHSAFWSDYKIDRFWSGDSFRCPEGQEKSYELALLLVRTLAECSEALDSFLALATFEDAGFSASESELGLKLEDVVSGFFGEGDWRPVNIGNNV